MFGCTRFIGRQVVDRALKAGHTVAVFHRGEHESEEMGEMLYIHGDSFDIVDHLETFESAREREVQMKRWNRRKKIWLNELSNPYRVQLLASIEFGSAELSGSIECPSAGVGTSTTT